LPQQGRFAAHVRTGENNDLLFVFIKTTSLVMYGSEGGSLFQSRVPAFFNAGITGMQLRFGVFGIAPHFAQSSKGNPA
jgi:hypothetical protein